MTYSLVTTRDAHEETDEWQQAMSGNFAGTAYHA